MQRVTTAFIMACALIVGACGSSDSSQTEPTESPGSTGAESPSSTGTESPGSSHQTVSNAACPEGGTPVPSDSAGPPENCNVMVDDCCFTDTDLACAAAGCEPGCTVMESYPGQIAPCN